MRVTYVFVGLVATAGLLLRCSGQEPAAPAADAGAPDAQADAEREAAVAEDAGPPDPVPVAAGPGKDEDPSLIRAADGTFYLAWFSDRSGHPNLYLKSSPDGTRWSADRAITTGLGPDFYPSLIQSTKGRFHVVWWRGAVNDAGAVVGSIFYASSADAQSWSAPIALTAADALAWTPTITERAPGRLVVAYSSNATGDKDLYFVSSDDGGATWAPTPVHLADPSFNDDLPFIVTRADGSLLVVWQRYDVTNKDVLRAPVSDLSNELVFATSTDGVTWTSPVALTRDPPGGATPDVTPTLFPSADPSGWSAAWASARAGSAGDVFGLGLSRALAVATELKQLTTTGGHSPRLVPTGRGDLHLMAWVGPARSADGSIEPDIFVRFVRP
jgi:hypothetical protein